METRPLGRTGEMMPILNTAIDRGIRYFDTAYVYSAGQSEQRVGLVAKDRRDEMWIATKLFDPSAEGAKRQLETSLTRLQTDHVDEWRMHDVLNMERLDAMFAKGGAIETMLWAQEQGMIKHISISGHTNPRVQIEALRRYPFSTVLAAVSVLDHFIYSFAEEFLPVAREQQVGVIGMKVFAYNRLGFVARDALRYCLGLPLTTCIVGCSTMEQLELDLDVAESFVPLTGPERLALFEKVMPMVKPDQMPWKSIAWKGTEWAARPA